MAVTLLSDTFIRANSATVGNGWTEVETGGQTASIESNHLKLTSNNSGLAAVYQSQTCYASIVTTCDVILHWQTNGQGLWVMQKNDTNTANGYGVRILHDATDTFAITDNGTVKATANFPLTIDTSYSIEFVIYAGSNWMEARIWATSGSRPTTPTVAWYNSGSAYTTTATGTNSYLLGNFDGSASVGYGYFNNFSTVTLTNLPISESFEELATGELNGKISNSAMWVGTSTIFTVGTTNPDSGANAVASVNNPAGNRGCFLGVGATFVFDQTFRMRVDTMPVNTDVYSVILHNQNYDGSDPSTGRVARIGVVRTSSTQYDALLSVAAGDTTIASSITTSAYHTFRFQVDSTRGTNGQIRASVDGGSFTSWVELSGSIVTKGIQSIGIINNTDTGTNTVYFDSFRDSSYVANGSVLIVGGAGGGGGTSGSAYSGGGGAGGYVYDTAYALGYGSYSVTVGAGGAGHVADGIGSNGQASMFHNVTSYGGGGGGGGGDAGGSKNGIQGASGGGGGGYATLGSGANPLVGQGNAGGNSKTANGGSGGGGGSGGSGANGPANDHGGNGGAGTSNSITGSAVTYAGGGGGAGTDNSTYGVGAGGGGNGGGNSGTANTGGGGGGNNGNGGAGGSGIVIISYPTGTFSASGYNSTGTSGGNTWVKFTASGILVLASPTSVKTFNGLARGSIKTINSLAIANVNKINGLL